MSVMYLCKALLLNIDFTTYIDFTKDLKGKVCISMLTEISNAIKFAVFKHLNGVFFLW